MRRVALIVVAATASVRPLFPQAIEIKVRETIGVTDVPSTTVSDPEFTVNTTDDLDDGSCRDDHCSLREAINAANASVRMATVAFDIPGAGPHTIQPASPLPRITAPMIIDGYTQPGARPNSNGPDLGTNAVIMIELDGINAGDGQSATGLHIRGGGTTVRGLAINRFASDGIVVLFEDGNRIQGNMIGTDVSGTEALPNDVGVLLSAGTQENIVGTDGDGVDDWAERNVISGNTRAGIWVQPGPVGAETHHNVVAGNLIGTDASGTAALPNTSGIRIVTGQDVGPKFNRIGTDADGVADVAERNVISGNVNRGIDLQESDGNRISGNFIGVNVSGDVALGNRRGVTINAGNANVVGGTEPAERNVISGNRREGVEIVSSSQNLVAGNFIGTDVTGGEPRGNGGEGVAIRFAADNTVQNNVISGNGGSAGLLLFNYATRGTRIEGNFIGTDLTGSHAVANTAPCGVLIAAGIDNTVGGTTSAARNLVSGNEEDGVCVTTDATGNRVVGNYVGTDVTGRAALGNGRNGIRISNRAVANWVGDASPGAGNVIAGNLGNGILIRRSEANEVQGNLIGTDVSGTADLGNAGHGVFFGPFARENTIGGTNSDAGNTIAFNDAGGVFVELETSYGNSVLSNRIYGNADLGIDLAPEGVTANDPGDADEGPNDLQNFPVITGFSQDADAFPGADPGTITGRLRSTPGGSFTLQFFANTACDASIFGEGATLLTELTVTSDGLGSAEFSASIPTPVDEAAFLTATATDDNTGSTSEFSRCRAAGYTVVSPGEQDITDRPLSGPGFRLAAAAAGGRRAAFIELCSTTLTAMTAGDRISVVCGSANIEVEVGPVEIVIDDNTEAIVPTDAVVTVEEVEDDQVQIQNESPAGSEPVQIAVGGDVVGEIGSGESVLQATIAVSTAELRVTDGSMGDADGLEVEGTLTLGSRNDGMDPSAEEVTVTLGSFTEAVAAGAFQRDDRRSEFKLERDPDAYAGISEMKIADSGEFTIEARNLDLTGMDLTRPVPFALRIGDDIASVAVPFNEDGEFQGAVASAGNLLAGAYDLRVGPERLTVAPRRAATYAVDLGARGVFAGKTVSLSCAELPVGAGCRFAPGTVTPDAGGATSRLTVTTDGSAGGLPGASHRSRARLGFGLVALLLGGLALGQAGGRWRRRTFISLGLLLLFVGSYSACADDALAPGAVGPVPPGAHEFQVVATAEDVERGVIVTLRVRDPDPSSEE